MSSIRQRLSVLGKPARLWALLKQTAEEWSDDKVPRLGAALAYYTVFSIVPLLVIVITLIGVIFRSEAAQGYVIDQLSALMGPQSADAIKDMIRLADRPKTGLFATIIATATLLLGASGLFGQLQEALNDIWGVKAKPGLGLWGYVQARFISLATVLGTAFLLLVSLVMSAGLAAFGAWYQGWLPAPEFVLQALELLLSIAVTTGLFAMMFKLLPDIDIDWADVWIGAALTAVLFTVGKFAIGLYIGKSDIGTAYGSAGSLVIFLVWVYYSAQIFLFGAEFTQVFAKEEGGHVVPMEHAVVADARKAPAMSATMEPVSAWSMMSALFTARRSTRNGAASRRRGWLLLLVGLMTWRWAHHRGDHAAREVR
ncbi:MAG: YihY/virulence factor BrkB family protein [Nitrospiraceae bacterium]